MSRRDQIKMTAEEVDDLLATEKVVTCATNGPDGLPHLMPLWFVVREGEVWAWTYARSQKVRNLERDARATLQVETGTEYQELRGVMLKCDVVVHRALEDVTPIGLAILRTDVAAEGTKVDVALGDGTIGATVDVLAVLDPQKQRVRS